MRRCAIALFALALLATGCGSDSDGDAVATTTSTTAQATTTSTTEADAEVPAVDAAVVCGPYGTVTTLLASVEEIATGSNDGQVAADEQLAAAVSTLQEALAGTSDELDAALATLAEVSFQVTEEPSGPTEDERSDAVATLDDAVGGDCADTGECPAPETLEAEGLQCDAEGNLTPVDGSDAVDEPTECPAPETLEAEGYTCDSEGNLTPIDPVECPAPETLEAEGYTCDSEGNLTPIDGGTADPSGPVTECPAPEVLEAEGYTCDAEGNLTPVG